MMSSQQLRKNLGIFNQSHRLESHQDDDQKFNSDNQIDYNDKRFQKELGMFRAFTFSLLLVLLIVMIVYMNYILLGQFFFCLFLSIITATSLRPYKDRFINYCYKSVKETDFLLSKSNIYSLIKALVILLHYYYLNGQIFMALKLITSDIRQALEKKLEKGKLHKVTIFNFVLRLFLTILILLLRKSKVLDFFLGSHKTNFKALLRSQFQLQVTQSTGIENLLRQYNLRDVDATFNQYLKVSVDYLKRNTNLSLPDEFDHANVTDIVDLIKDIIKQPQKIHPDFPPEWNKSIIDNDEMIRNSYASGFIPQNAYPYLVLIYTVLQQFDLTQLINQVMTFFMKINSSAYSLIMFGISNVLALLLTLSNFAFNVILYFTLVTYLLQDENDFIEKLLSVIPVENSIRNKIVQTVNESIKGIFLSNIKIAVFQAIYTWLLFDYFQIKYLYIYALIASFFKIVPIVSTFTIGMLGGNECIYGLLCF
ncbi:UNKNOWN [Stylonychia lemnae]|uniref:Transmembrane protein n=1 Tax=Stylonychia lemnae TaxID=5949 RepID=A0A078A519_STYLE|nr:UNKNOWN [Stylonychia lemnae]|eukprot:CDW76959.1 UNKNOWN [Stylonychia lemnae]